MLVSLMVPVLSCKVGSPSVLQWAVSDGPIQVSAGRTVARRTGCQTLKMLFRRPQGALLVLV